MKITIKCCLAVALGLAIAGCDGGHKKVQLWEGGPYWAETNIGAEKPWESGYHFWWGDTIGYKRVNDAWFASDGSPSRFFFDRDVTPTCCMSDSELRREGWITADGVLSPEHDAAHVHWGGKWRMPTNKELEDLCRKCDWEKKTLNGVNGCVVRGRGDYASRSIFLPCAGFASGASLRWASRGYYRSSVPCGDGNYSWDLEFGSKCDTGVGWDLERSAGNSVRPVQGFTK